MKTPIFGPFSQASSTNLVDAQCMNLIPKVDETKQGKEIGALFFAPGLRLFATAGNGPIWGEHVFGDLLFVASGNDIYSINTNGTPTFLGSVTGVTGLINMKDNGSQLGIFTTTGAWIIGIGGVVGVPLVSATILTGGVNYNPGDLIYLTQASGTQIATAVFVVNTVDGFGGVTGSNIAILNGLPLTGLFVQTALPTSFSQAFTTGSGSGFQLTSPIYGAPTSLYQIPLPFSPVSGQISAVQQDGYIVISQPGTYKMWQSELLDMSLFLSTKFASASGNPTVIQSMQQIHREIFVIGTYDTEVWINAGTSPFTFARLDGVFIEKGTSSPASVCQAGEDLMWLALDSDGTCSVVRLHGYDPRIVSDFTVTTIWQTYTTINDAIAYSYQLNGKRYYIISFPSGDATWGYNITDSDLLGIPVWFQIGAFDNGQFHRHWAQVGSCNGSQGALFDGKIILGDYRNGTLYSYDSKGLTDNGTRRKWLRSWRARPAGNVSFEPLRFNALQIDMQTGIGIVTDNPQVILRWSDDGGHSWSTEHFVPAGKIGQTALRVKINRLGSTKRNAGLDRIFELSSADIFPVTIIDADLI